MDVQNLRINYPKLISYMEENGYSPHYINALKYEINFILTNASLKSWTSYADIHLEHREKLSSTSYLSYKQALLGLIEDFDIHGLYPNGQRRHKFVLRGKYHLLTNEFKAVIDSYYIAEKERNTKDAITYRQSLSAISFFFSLQEKGIDFLEKITEEAVLSVFVTPEGSLYRSYDYKRNIASFLKVCIPNNPEIYKRILSFLPALRVNRKNIQYLLPEEVAKMKQILNAKESPLSPRDKAIGILAMYTGLRGCDIAGLTIDSIDWSKDIINIKQQKTKVPLTLPLTAIVGNAIYDYLTLERPETENKYIFISYNRPYGRLKGPSLSNICKKIMKVANIRQSDGDRRGFHIFRHHIATELLSNGIPQPVISRTLGHTSPKSLESYLSADLKHLKECALSIEKYPLRTGVICDE